jgi:hypothetical protein
MMRGKARYVLGTPSIVTARSYFASNYEHSVGGRRIGGRRGRGEGAQRGTVRRRDFSFSPAHVDAIRCTIAARTTVIAAM